MAAGSSRSDLGSTARFSCAYEKVVHWRRNLFNVPFGKAGGSFVDEIADLIKSFAEGTSLRNVAWKAVVVACQLLL